MTTLIEVQRNSILAALPATDWQRIESQLDLVEMPLGTTLYDSVHETSHIYFPSTAVISLRHVTQSGAASEIAMVGNEGIVGISLLIGGESIPSRAVVKTAGYCFRLESRVLKTELNRAGLVMTLLLRYTQALITQMAQITACKHQHSLEQQLCRWLLQSLERQPGNELALPESLIDDILGAQRDNFRATTQGLQRAGLIHYAGGHIRILEKSGLAARACECHSKIKSEYQRLLAR